MHALADKRRVTQRGFGSLVLCLGVGLLLGLLCLAAGLAVTGMGHGWEVPFQYGLLSLLLYPLAVMRWWWVGRQLPWRRDAAATAGMALPIMAVLSVFGMLPFFLGGWPLFVIRVPLHWLVGRALERAGRQAAAGDIGLLAIGVALSLAALSDHQTPEYAARSWPAQLHWLPLWLGWQVIAALALARHLRSSQAA